MFELLLEPAKLFINAGMDSFKKSKELANLKIAVRQRITREIKLNAAVLDEIIKNYYDKEGAVAEKNALIMALRTRAFDDLNDGAIPVSLLISGDVEHWPAAATKDEKDRYLKYLSSIKTPIDLLDRAYYRIHIARILASSGKCDSDLKYIRYMLTALIVNLRDEDN
ncbi:hypothetical protein BN137_853 [Cronobacter condimenti 1330]|uniref:Uncharacterized protein n=1 Tax=Cronobacter condimenti 1330 TaxID=1073999 RepID=K7ZYB2_9ENTR|nr:hypothetical protein [Cronobacter condimenti]ALB62188.1 hypothetical protein AFK62_06595 [Cronobacter condimenti 1330]CCJ71513.1 hypothetical protein BN137_853 [Cronobacter condimenti 1330]